MQRQYRAIKRELPPGSILMFRLGDFYEMFGEDAVIASPILGATLTQRAGAPLCGIPYHALDAYLAKLIRAGKTAAICDQMEDPRTVKKGAIVRREVTRIVTPGTVTEDGLLDADANCYIAAVSGLGLALLDLSTGEAISGAELLAFLGLSSGDLADTELRIMGEEFEYQYGAESMGENAAFYDEQYSLTVSPDNTELGRLWLDSEGELNFVAKIYSLAGAEFYEYPMGTGYYF